MVCDKLRYLLYLTSMCQNVDHTQSISCISTIVQLKMRFPFPFQELVSLNSVMVVYFGTHLIAFQIHGFHKNPAK